MNVSHPSVSSVKTNKYLIIYSSQQWKSKSLLHRIRLLWGNSARFSHYKTNHCVNHYITWGPRVGKLGSATIVSLLVLTVESLFPIRGPGRMYILVWDYLYTINWRCVCVYVCVQGSRKPQAPQAPLAENGGQIRISQKILGRCNKKK